MSVRTLTLTAALTLAALSTAAGGDDDVTQVFLLAGQSNMQGQGVVDLDHPDHYNGGRGTLLRVIETTDDPERFAHLRDADGQWTVRDDVAVRYQTKTELKQGGLSIGFSGYGGKHHIGPELQFGHVVGDATDAPVLLVKTAWGGKSLHVDFRPPSAGGETGVFYTQMLEELGEALDEIDGEYQIAGFVWFQGWNDMISEEATAEYADNLVHLVTDVRAALGIPDLPVVIGELGNGGPDAGDKMLAFRAAQAEGTARIRPEGSATFVETAPFARPKEDSPNTGHGHHWFGNAESYYLIGEALGEAMVTHRLNNPR